MIPERDLKRIKMKYPDRVAVIVQCKDKNPKHLLDKYKYIIPNDMCVAQFSYIIRQRLRLLPSEALFIFLENGILPPSNQTIASIPREEDFVHLFYAFEKTFGCDVALGCSPEQSDRAASLQSHVLPAMHLEIFDP